MTNIFDRSDINLKDKTCKYCGELFKPKSAVQKRCYSSQCMIAHDKAQKTKLLELKEQERFAMFGKTFRREHLGY